MGKKRHDWSHVATEEPYFGVLASDKYRAASITDDDIEAFYQSGRDDIQRLRELCKTVIGVAPAGRTLDFGCGVGRHTFAISKFATRVTGYDVADEMLDIARARALKEDG
ncbi:MAG: methyltransferase domain-containing protein [Pseudomonadota bacterium]